MPLFILPSKFIKIIFMQKKVQKKSCAAISRRYVYVPITATPTLVGRNSFVIISDRFIAEEKEIVLVHGQSWDYLFKPPGKWTPMHAALHVMDVHGFSLSGSNSIRVCCGPWNRSQNRIRPGVNLSGANKCFLLTAASHAPLNSADFRGFLRTLQGNHPANRLQLPPPAGDWLTRFDKNC